MAYVPKPIKCSPELLEQDLTGKNYIITGANSGVGLGTAEQLLKQGANVFFACRNEAKYKFALSNINSDNLPGKASYIHLDLSDLDSVRKCSSEILRDIDIIDGLVNNAALMMPPKKLTKNGFESQFGVNHLGHFLLTELLLEKIITSSPSRIVNVSSVAIDGLPGNKPPDINFEDLNFEKRKYNRAEAYAQSKLANCLYTNNLSRRLSSNGVTVVSIHPGWVRSNLERYVARNIFAKLFTEIVAGILGGKIDYKIGAHTTLHVLLDKKVEEMSGKFFSQVGVYKKKPDRNGGWPMVPPNIKVEDNNLSDKLYEVSKVLVGL